VADVSQTDSQNDGVEKLSVSKYVNVESIIWSLAILLNPFLDNSSIALVLALACGEILLITLFI
jgi:hypothetical protein